MLHDIKNDLFRSTTTYMPTKCARLKSNFIFRGCVRPIYPQEYHTNSKYSYLYKVIMPYDVFTVLYTFYKLFLCFNYLSISDSSTITTVFFSLPGSGCLRLPGGPPFDLTLLTPS